MSLSAREIRRQFIDFFVDKADHTEVPSSPVVPHEDPTLLFTNAGMNQFKDVFLGQGSRPFTRAVDTQKCIRAGGKHNDLEDVGRDTYHHTFFEMLGNWSFGDYFKPEAIGWAFEILTETYGIDPDRLHASYFGGDKAAGLEPDEEARELWLRHLPEKRVLPFGMKDNFWEMGDTGPCGPCSELHFDRIGNRDARSLVNADDPNVIEIWNLVFIQFNRESATRLVPLPSKHVDTGMGFERLVSVLQDKGSNYDTDLWAPIFEKIRETCDAPAYEGVLEARNDMAYRILADHARCLTAAITDGAMPGADGRGYVLRRILRRAVRHGRQTFGVQKPFLASIIPSVVDVLGDVFPEMKRQQDQVMTVINEEEEAFRRTLDRGLELFDQAAKRTSGGRIEGKDAFRLHDTYGFPIDLTTVMAEERALKVDLDAYEQLMKAARERSRSGGDEADPVLMIPPDGLAKLTSIGVKATRDEHKFEGTANTANVRAIWNGENFVEHLDAGERAAVILDRTSFYGEQGGQVGDTGTFHVSRVKEHHAAEGGTVVRIEETTRVGDHVLHIGVGNEGRLHVGDEVEAFADAERRDAIRANHTTTHLLNLSLRETVGEGCDQRGSMVSADRLRFDYAAKGALDGQALASIEEGVNRRIREGLEVHTAVVPLDDAKTVNTVRAVFGEQYPDPVRVVSIGPSVEALLGAPDSADWMEHSVEFCGGTHLEDTSKAGDFVLLSEQGLAAGIRRIVGLTGAHAADARETARNIRARIQSVEALADQLVPEAFDGLNRDVETVTLGATDRILIEEALRSIRKRAKNARKQARSQSNDVLLEQALQLAAEAEGPMVLGRIDGADKDGLLAAMDAIHRQNEDGAVLLVSADEDAGKVLIVARVSKQLIAGGLKAGDWVKVAAQACGGGGGGRPDSAQAGGKDPSRANEALEAAREHASRIAE
jgi:alanyl-tRNA synthetase